MPFYEKHVFFCENQKKPGKQCCQDNNASEMREYAKSRIKALGQHGFGQIRINKAGCLGRCAEGPAIVIYPEGTWYTYDCREDIDELIEEALLKGNIVKHLLMDPE